MDQYQVRRYESWYRYVTTIDNNSRISEPFSSWLCGWVTVW
jgi:hypothetical protein